MANSLMWICFSPITNITTAYFNISGMQVNWLSLVYLIASIPCGFTASWLIDTLGLRISIILAAWLNVIGALLRSLTTYTFIPSDMKYPVLLTGQLIAACAQPFIMFCPTKLAAVWFPGSQRATANTIASMANPLGILLANIMSPKIVQTKADMPLMLWVCTGLSGLGAIIATFGVCSSGPPTPPSASAAEVSEPFFSGLKKLLKVKSYWLLWTVFGAGLAIFSANTTFIEQILCPRDYQNSFSGLCGALMIAIGAVGGAVAGLFVDKTKLFEEVIKMSLGLATLFGIFFTLISRLRGHPILTAISISGFGFFGFAIYPISMELAVEITYPVAEATSSGFLFISGQIQGVIYMLAAQYLAQPLPANEVILPNGCRTNGTSGNDISQDWTVPNLFFNALAALGTVILILFFHPNYRRMRAEDVAKAESILNYDSTDSSHSGASNRTPPMS
ncbi:hypothetical protein SNE40_007500 [Patella caerulea]|uniref:Major facilitator superfamily (MFS) profile domain-containing protein n=2 Tax=Patella caerulea TaxID=87958 RepID=A0AAN8PXJ6_PATCE